MFTTFIIGLGITWFIACIIYLIFFEKKIKAADRSVLLKKLKDSIEKISALSKKPETKEILKCNSELEISNKELKDYEDRLLKIKEELEQTLRPFARNPKAFEDLVNEIRQTLVRVNATLESVRNAIEKNKSASEHVSQIDMKKLMTELGIPEYLDEFLSHVKELMNSVEGRVEGAKSFPKALKYACFAFSIILFVLGNLLYFKIV
jgi:hypothetical protein